MAASLGTLTLDLVARIGNFVEPMRNAESQTRSTASNVQQQFDNISSSAKGMVASVAGLVSVGALFNTFVQNTRDAEQEQKQLAAVLKSTGQAAGYNIDQLNDMASALGENTVISGGEITQAQTSLLAFTGIVGKEFPRAMQAAIDMSARTGMSVVSAAETIGRALDVPSAGMGALSKQGFKFTEDQKKLAKQLEETGHSAEAQAIIFDALESTYAGAAQAAREGFTGSLTAVKNSFNDLLSGDGSLDAVTAALNTFNSVLKADNTKDYLDSLVVLGGTAGVGYLAGSTINATKAMVDNIAVVKGKILLDAEALVAEQARTGGLLLQARTLAASTAAEVRAAEIEVAATAGTNAHTAALARLHGARLADVAATRAQTVAQEVHNVSMATARFSGAALVSTLTSPVGLAVGAAAVAAGFLLMRDTSDEAKDALSDQSLSADDLVSKYKALNAEEKQLKLSKLTEQLESQKDKLDGVTVAMGLYIGQLREGMANQATITAVETYFAAIKNGGVGAAKAFDTLSARKLLSKDQLDDVAEYGTNLQGVASAADALQNKIDILNGKNVAVIGSVNGASSAITNQGNAAANATGQVNGLTEAMQKYIDKTKEGIVSNSIQLNLRGQGYTPDQSKALADAVAANGGKPITGEQAGLTLAGVASNNALAASNKSLADAAARVKKAEDEKAAAIKKANDEHKKLLEKQADMRKNIGSMFASSLEQNRFSYTDTKKDILGAGFSDADQKKYLSIAERYYQKIDDEYFKHLNLELKEYVWTEQQKLDYAYKMDQQILANDTANLDEITLAKREALDRTYAYETQKVALQNKKELLDFQQSYMSQMDYVTERYKLEREEIAATQGKSQEWKKAALESSKTNEFMEQQSIQGAAFGTFSSAFELDDAAVLQNKYDSELSQQGDLLNQKLISYEQYQQSYAAITEKYMRQEQDQQYSLQNAMLGQAATVWGGMTELVKKSSGESSGAYKTMFLVQQAFAIAQALINTELAATQALTLGPILGIPAATIVRGLGYASVGLIAAQTVAGVAGQAHDGIMEVPDSGTWNLQKGERVLPQKTAARLDRTLDRVQGGAAPKVTINNYGSDRVEVTDDGNGGITIDIIQQMIDRRAPAAVASDLSGSNSVTRKAVASAFNVAPNR